MLSILLYTGFWASDPDGLNQKPEMGPRSLHSKRNTQNDTDLMLSHCFRDITRWYIILSQTEPKTKNILFILYQFFRVGGVDRWDLVEHYRYMDIYLWDAKDYGNGYIISSCYILITNNEIIGGNLQICDSLSSQTGRDYSLWEGRSKHSCLSSQPCCYLWETSLAVPHAVQARMLVYPGQLGHPSHWNTAGGDSGDYCISPYMDLTHIAYTNWPYPCLLSRPALMCHNF